MPFLSDLVGQAKQQVTNQVRGVENSVRGGIRGAIANAKNDATNAGRGAVNNVLNQGVNSAIGVASDLIKGDLGGALGRLTNAPSDLASAFVNGITGKALNGAGSLIGASSQFSSSGGITPGFDLLGAQARPDPLMAYCWFAQMPIIKPPAVQSTFGSALGGTAGNLGSELGGVIGGTLGGGFGSVVGGIAGGFGAQALGSKLGGSVFASQGAATELPWYFVEGASVPSRQFSQTELFREGRSRKYPSRYDVQELRLTFYLDSDNTTYKYLQAWQNQILQPYSASTAAQNAGGFGRPVNYKQNIRIYLLSVARQELCILEYVECWPLDLGSLDLTSGTPDRLTLEVPFSVGDMFVSILPVSSTTVNSIVNNPSDFPGAIQFAVGNLTKNAINFGTNTVKGLANDALSSVSSLF